MVLRSGSAGVVAYAHKRRVSGACGLALIAGALGAADGARAAESATTSSAPSVAELDVVVLGRLMGHDTGLQGLPTTVQDTPQAISIVGAAQLKAQNVTSLEQALRNVPGITIAIGEGGTLSGDQFKIRGFDAKDDVYVDGLRDFGSYVRDSFNYEEVQVLKGPSGAMFGRGATGGAINTLSKRPKLGDFGSVDAYVGNGDYYRALGDVNRQVGDTSAVRATAMFNDTGVVDRDHIRTRRWGVAVTAATGLGTDTTASISYLHQHSNGRPDYGVIIVQRPGDIVAKPATEYGVGVERSSFLGFLNDVDRGNVDILTARLSHKVGDKLVLSSDTRFGRYTRYFQYSTLDQCSAACTANLFDGDPATEAYGGIGGGSPYSSDAWGLQNISTARIDSSLGGKLKNQLILGVDLSKQVNDRRYYAYTLPAGVTTRPNMAHPIVNPNPVFPAGYGVFDPVTGGALSCPASGNCTTASGTVTTNVAGTGTLNSRGSSKDAAAFVTDRLWFTGQLSVIGSFRYDDYTAELITRTYAGAYSPTGGLKVNSKLKSPRVSAVFEPTGDQTYYVSWGRSQTPQGTSIVGAGTALTVTAKDLKPENSRIWEAGAKVGVPGTRLSFTASVFDINKDNALQVDPATGFLQAQSGEKQEVKGVELGLTGKLTAGWTVSAGYTYLNARIRESYSNCTLTPANAAGVPSGIACAANLAAAVPVLNTVAVGRQATFVPKNAASLFTTYDLGRLAPGLSIGGDVVYQSKLAVGYAARSLSYADRATLTAARLSEVPESLTFDAYVAYRTGPYRFAVNLYNLTDRLNYTQVFANRATPAAGRTVIVSVGAAF